ncbi:MAG: thiamine phosphate synthase [Bacteroidales bacterium]|nr:thiamine phosphate synthase [Bacteroidales bacterium]
MSRNDLDISLYLVTDRPLSRGRDIRWIVEEAVKGGCTIVQLREKDCSTKEFVDLAIQLKQTLKPLGIPLIINDRIDVALASDADGVHIGQSDMPYEIARKILGPDKIIGLSVETLDEVTQANDLDVDYIGISPIFATNTKTDTYKPFGLNGLTQAMIRSKHPAVGIGGMNHKTAADVMKHGADGIAVVSDIVSADSPKQSSQELLKIVNDNKGSWSDNAWSVIQPIMEDIRNHPFVQEMTAGNLHKTRFLHYLQQDIIYIANYGKEMFQLADMLPESRLKTLFTQFAHEGIAAEETLHNQLMQEFGSANAEPYDGTTEYMNHTKQFFEPADLSMALAAMLPSMWVYNSIGSYILSIEQGGEKNPYHEWISYYSSPLMNEGIKNSIELINELASKESLKRRAAMRYAFVKSAMLELKFWDQAYKSM